LPGKEPKPESIHQDKGYQTKRRSKGTGAQGRFGPGIGKSERNTHLRPRYEVESKSRQSLEQKKKQKKKVETARPPTGAKRKEEEPQELCRQGKHLSIRK